jgi:hypothetical protein
MHNSGAAAEDAAHSDGECTPRAAYAAVYHVFGRVGPTCDQYDHFDRRLDEGGNGVGEVVRPSVLTALGANPPPLARELHRILDRPNIVFATMKTAIRRHAVYIEAAKRALH